MGSAHCRNISQAEVILTWHDSHRSEHICDQALWLVCVTETMLIEVRNITGEAFTVADVDLQAKVIVLKRQIEQTSGIQIQTQRLIFLWEGVAG